MSENSGIKANITPKPVVESNETGKNVTIAASVNPLVFIDADDRFNFPQLKRELNPQSVLKYLSSETFIPEMENIKKNYDEIAKDINRVVVVPAEYKIIEKIVRPLKSSIGSFIIGNYPDTIFLCGTVAEMITVFLFEINELTTDGKPIQNDKELKTNQKRFEHYRQSERIKKLLEIGLIDTNLKQKFDTIRKIRNSYAHKLSKTHENAANDAKKVFRITLDVFLITFNLSIKNGRALINQKILDYLEKKNLIEKTSK